jgi:hypothetical protein
LKGLEKRLKDLKTAIYQNEERLHTAEFLVPEDPFRKIYHNLGEGPR